MADETLAKWQRRSLVPGQAPPRHEPEVESAKTDPAPADKAEYKGDVGRDRGGWIEFQPLKGPWSLCPAAQLRKVQFNGENPTRIDFFFIHEIVTVKGRNLRAYISGIRTRSLAEIKQFNPATEKEPAENELRVDSIEAGSIIPVDGTPTPK
jgi:hypothetical protein